MANKVCLTCGIERDEDFMTERKNSWFCSQSCYSSLYQTQSIDTSMAAFTNALDGFGQTLNGFTGKSAYQSWLDNGNTGTVEEFILSWRYW
jgi:hypothetical protein